MTTINKYLITMSQEILKLINIVFRDDFKCLQKCYSYGQLFHPTYRFLEKESSSNNEKRIGYDQEDT